MVKQGRRQDLPEGGLGSPTMGLNKRIEVTFLCIRTQFSVENSPTDTKFFPVGRGGGKHSPTRGLQPPAPPPSCVNPG